MIGVPHLTIPHAAIPHGTLPGSLAGYNVYRGVSVTDLELLANLPVGVHQVTSVQQSGTVWTYGLTAVSDYGRESAAPFVLVVEIDPAGQLVGLAPNAVRSALAVAAAGGRVRVEVVYSAAGQSGQAASVRVARRHLDGSCDWDTPLATVSVGKSLSMKSALLDGVYAHGETLRLAARAFTAGGVGGETRFLPPVVAWSAPPPAVELLLAECLS